MQPSSRSKAATEAAALSAKRAFLVLLAARTLSALFNIIPDCDETYNYLEPLHFLLHGSGFQTWEYSARYALRPYLYLLLHGLVAGPAAALFGSGRGKLATFYILKLAMGAASAATEAMLYRAVRRRCSPAVARAFLLFLTVSSGMFIASTGMLPSSFTMYAVTAAAALVLEGRLLLVIPWAAAGIVWGWSVAAIAFLPYALWVLTRACWAPAFTVAGASLLGTAVPMALLDRWFYGRWTSSLLNFIIYNVAGGGDSALYGVEGPAFYLRNGFNNFQFVLPLALAVPAILALRAGSSGLWAGAAAQQQQRGKKQQQQQQALGSSSRADMAVALSPLFAWLAAISSLPHKEERFLFVVYPLICLAAALTFVALHNTARQLLARRLPRTGTTILALLSRTFLLGTCALAVSRTTALVLNYGAPMQLYRALPEVRGAGPPIPVCAGAEWHRFPSHFHLPGERYRLQFIKSGFDGLLPRHFDPAESGTAAAPPQFNDRNREEPANYWPKADGCAYAVTLREGGQPIDALGTGPWETVTSLPFVDHARSPAWARAFYLPWLSRRACHFVEYALLRRA